MAIALLVLVISAGAVAAGVRYVRTAHRMSSFATTRGTVTGRAVQAIPVADGREGRWGRGGGYQPVVTYDYVVNGVSYTSTRWSHAADGLKRSVAEQTVAAVPDAVDVHYDPTAPQEAYLYLSTPRLGWILTIGGMFGLSAAVLMITNAASRP